MDAREASHDERSRLRRVVAYFDPGEAGFVGRLKRVALAGALIVACGACGLVAVALRTPLGRYAAAAMLVEIGQPGAAERVARGLVDDHPSENNGYYFVLASALHDQGRHEEEREVYAEAVQAMPDDWSANRNYCWFEALFGRAGDVMAYCDRAVERAPTDRGSPFARRGAAKAMAGDREGAIEDMREAIRRWDRFGGPDSRPAPRFRRWLAALEGGENPFDERTLRRLRGEDDD
jgi:tetratricopeptide (TPR) repeat protein